MHQITQRLSQFICDGLFSYNRHFRTYPNRNRFEKKNSRISNEKPFCYFDYLSLLKVRTIQVLCTWVKETPFRAFVVSLTWASTQNVMWSRNLFERSEFGEPHVISTLWRCPLRETRKLWWCFLPTYTELNCRTDGKTQTFKQKAFSRN